MTQRSSELGVQALPAGVGRHLRGKSGEQTPESLGAMALQGEDVLELVYDPLDELPLSGSPSPRLLRPCPASAFLRGSCYQRPIGRHPVLLPFY
jgi:hypothetical protein